MMRRQKMQASKLLRSRNWMNNQQKENNSWRAIPHIKHGAWIENFKANGRIRCVNGSDTGWKTRIGFWIFHLGPFKAFLNSYFCLFDRSFVFYRSMYINFQAVQLALPTSLMDDVFSFNLIRMNRHFIAYFSLNTWKMWLKNPTEREKKQQTENRKTAKL